MSHVHNLLIREKQKLEKKLHELVKLHDTPWLSKGFIALQRSNMALKRYIDSNEADRKAYWWAEKWNELRKSYVKKLEKQDNVSYPGKRAKIELAIGEINGQLFRYKLKG